MFNRVKRLTQAQKVLAVQVTKDAFAKSGGNKVEFERLVREDSRVKAIDPMLIVLFIRVVMLVFEYFKNRHVSGTPALGMESDADVYINSLRFEE